MVKFKNDSGLFFYSFKKEVNKVLAVLNIFNPIIIMKYLKILTSITIFSFTFMNDTSAVINTIEFIQQEKRDSTEVPKTKREIRKELRKVLKAEKKKRKQKAVSQDVDYSGIDTMYKFGTILGISGGVISIGLLILAILKSILWLLIFSPILLAFFLFILILVLVSAD